MPARASAQATLLAALDVMLRLLAPIMPYATEEVWSWWHEDSIHRASWPRVDEIEVDGDPQLLGDIAAALVEIRGAKSQAKVSMKTEVTAAHISRTGRRRWTGSAPSRPTCGPSAGSPAS